MFHEQDRHPEALKLSERTKPVVDELSVPVRVDDEWTRTSAGGSRPKQERFDTAVRDLQPGVLDVRADHGRLRRTWWRREQQASLDGSEAERRCTGRHNAETTSIVSQAA